MTSGILLLAQGKWRANLNFKAVHRPESVYRVFTGTELGKYSSVPVSGPTELVFSQFSSSPGFS